MPDIQTVCNVLYQCGLIPRQDFKMPDTLLLQSSNSFYRIILQLIFHNNHTCINTVAGTQYQAFGHFMQSFRISYSILVHQPIVACQYLFATDVCFQSVPGNLRHRPYQIKGCLLLFCILHHGFCHRVVALAFCRCNIFQNFCLRIYSRSLYPANAKVACSQCTGLVKNKRVCFRDGVQIIAPLEKNAFV